MSLSVRGAVSSERSDGVGWKKRPRHVAAGGGAAGGLPCAPGVGRSVECGLRSGLADRSTQSHMEYACWGSARAADFGYNLRKLDSELREIRAVMHTIMCMCLLLSLGSLRSALVALCL